MTERDDDFELVHGSGNLFADFDAPDASLRQLRAYGCWPVEERAMRGSWRGRHRQGRAGEGERGRLERWAAGDRGLTSYPLGPPGARGNAVAIRGLVRPAVAMPYSPCSALRQNSGLGGRIKLPPRPEAWGDARGLEPSRLACRHRPRWP